MPQPLLSVNHLGVDFEVQGGVAPVIDDVSFELNAGETLTLVGESGCGKKHDGPGNHGIDSYPTMQKGFWFYFSGR